MGVVARVGGGHSPASSDWPASWFDADGFDEGLISGAIGAVALLLLGLCARAVCKRVLLLLPEPSDKAAAGEQAQGHAGHEVFQDYRARRRR